MPFSKEICLEDDVRVGIWHITETTEELLTGLALDLREEELFKTYSHPQRKKQWLAYRAVLRHLLPKSTPVNLKYDEHGKPSLTCAPGFISVSHAGDFAAAVYSERVAVGIDIEQIKARIERVKERFLSDAELREVEKGARLEKLYVHWGAKEALYKLYGRPEIDFKNDIILHPFDYLCDTDGTCKATLTTPQYSREFRVFYQKKGENMLTVAY